MSDVRRKDLEEKCKALNIMFYGTKHIKLYGTKQQILIFGIKIGVVKQKNASKKFLSRNIVAVIINVICSMNLVDNGGDPFISNTFYIEEKEEIK